MMTGLAVLVGVLMLASGALAAPGTPCADPVAYTAKTADGGTTVVWVSLCDRVFRSSTEPQLGDGSGPSNGAEGPSPGGEAPGCATE